MNLLNKKYITLIFLTVLAFSFVNKTFEQPGQPSIKCDRTVVTVWLHGTKLAPSILFKNLFYRLPGMRLALEYDKESNKRVVAEQLSEIAPEEYPLESFYYFGWNGKLCFRQRKKAAKDLYHDLVSIIETHTNDLGMPPYVRIIAHSHGGNVVLNLAKLKKTEPIQIDELILLACPVQEKTKKLIISNCFKKIYSFYSAGDLFQVLDPQGWYKKGKSKKTFSERLFDHHNTLRQAAIKINGKSPMHINFSFTNFTQYLPEICRVIDELYDSLTDEELQQKKQINIHTKQAEPVITTKLL